MPLAVARPSRPPSEYNLRLIVPPVLASRSTRAIWPKAKGNSLATKQGLRYENRVAKEFQHHEKRGHVARVEHNPWFTYSDCVGVGACSPDFLLWLDESNCVVVEVKLTWIEVARHKLIDLYLPVLKAALGEEVSLNPIIVCRHLTPNSPPAKHSLREALTSDFRLLNWIDNGRMIW